MGGDALTSWVRWGGEEFLALYPERPGRLLDTVERVRILAEVAQVPHVTVHLKGEAVANFPPTALVVNDPAERRPLIEVAAKTWGRTDIDVMLEHSPLIEVTVEDYRGGSGQPGEGLTTAHNPIHSGDSRDRTLVPLTALVPTR